MLYNIVLVSAIQHHGSALSIYVPSLLKLLPTPKPILPLLVVIEYWVEHSVLCSFFPPAFCFTYGNVYVSMVLSQFDHPLLTPLCLEVRSLCLHLYSCLAGRFISTIFLYSLHMLIYVLVLLTYFILYNRL